MSKSSKPAPARSESLLHARRPALETMLAPRNVAVIGASERAGSVGRTIMENLLAGAFRGSVFPVNPQHDTILGIEACARVGDIPAPVDLAVIATPASVVPEVVRECGSAGIPGAVIISAGFREVGESGRELEKQILDHAREHRMRIIGPNCLGVMIPHLGLNATFAAAPALPGNVAFVSQSGALCTAILDWSLREKVGFSAFISIGAMLDVGWGDLIDFLADDPHTKSIVCYMESVGNARAFLSAAREVSFTKPVIVIKVGRTAAAAKAAASHTGSLTGSDEVLDAALRRAGVLRVDTIEELFDMANLLAKQPRPAGPRLAIITNAGGPGALATDMLVRTGATLANLAPQTIAALDEILPPHWSRGNPVDLLGDASAGLYAKGAELVLDDPGADGALVILTPQAMTQPDETAARIASLAKSSRKPILASWMGGDSLDAARATLNAAGIPTFDYPDAAARAFAHMWHYSDHLRLLYERPTLPAAAGRHVENTRTASRILNVVRKSGRTILTEPESKAILAAYGIPTVETLVAHSADEAVAHAEKLGFPVVLKLLSETITHKTDVGGVHLNLTSARAVRHAFSDIEHSVEQKTGPGNFDGVTVQPMIDLSGTELILGSSIDPQFGPVILFGSGGTDVELTRDSAIGFPPLTENLAFRLMERTRIYRLLQGSRRRAPVDLPALARILVSFSHLLAEQPWIAELDINPLLASPDRLIALDARVILHPPTLREEELPRLAIRSYPVQYVRRIHLPDHTPLTLRPIRPEDEELLIEFHSTLSEETVHLRYFEQLPLATRIAHERLARICFADYDREIAIVAEHHTPGRSPEIIAVARLNRRHGRNESEFALLVADHWQNRGIGTHLMEMLIEIGRAEKLDRIFGAILTSNHTMIDLCRRSGFHLREEKEIGEVIAELPL